MFQNFGEYTRRILENYTECSIFLKSEFKNDLECTRMIYNFVECSRFFKNSLEFSKLIKNVSKG